jgi:hypothetical protein
VSNHVYNVIRNPSVPIAYQRMLAETEGFEPSIRLLTV